MRKKLQQAIHLSDLGDLASPHNDWRHIGPLVGAAFCLLVYYLAIFFEAMASFYSLRQLRDFGSFYASVFAWSHHLNPYLAYPLTFDIYLDIRGLFVRSVNLNPPISLYVLRPLVALGPIASRELWTLVSACLFCVCIILVVRANPNPALRTRILLALGMAGVWTTFLQGQVYMVLLLLTVVAWLSFRKNNFITAGIAIGLICALKPDFLIWPVLLILARHIKAGISALLTFATASMVPIMFGNGALLYRQWLAACRHYNGLETTGSSAIIAMFARLDPYLGITHHFRDVGFALTIIFLTAITWRVMRKAPDVFRVSEVALVATLLVGPISWVGYTVVLIPMLYERRLNALMRIGWVVLCIPFFTVPRIAESSTMHFMILGSPYFYGLALIAAALMRELYQEHPASRTFQEAKVPASEAVVWSEAGSVAVGENT